MSATKLPKSAPVTTEQGIERIKALMGHEDYKAKMDAWLGNSDAFIASILHIVNTDPQLSLCEPESLCNAAAMAARLRLPVNSNIQYAYIGACDGNYMEGNKLVAGLVAQFQIGWRGYVQLANRTGEYTRINVTDVREGELVNNDRLSGDVEFAWMEEKERQLKNTIGYVSFFRLKTGLEKMLYWPIDRILAHGAKYSSTFNAKDKGWQREQDSMCRKTMIKKILSEYGPMSMEVALAVAADQAHIMSVESDGKFAYPDNPTNEVPVSPKIARAAKANDAIQNLLDITNGKKPLASARRKAAAGKKK